MVRDRIVVGLLDETFRKVSPNVNNGEAAVQSKIPSGKGKTNQPKQQFPSVQNPHNYQQQSVCTHCGKAPFHPKHQCSARDAECHEYRKIGHFQSMCRFVRGLSQITKEVIFSSQLLITTALPQSPGLLIL